MMRLRRVAVLPRRPRIAAALMASFGLDGCEKGKKLPAFTLIVMASLRFSVALQEVDRQMVLRINAGLMTAAIGFAVPGLQFGGERP
jgi:hypothetical protein